MQRRSSRISSCIPSRPRCCSSRAVVSRRKSRACWSSRCARGGRRERAEVREIQLDAFTSVEADELVASMAVGQGAPGEVATLLRESRGNPLFLSELARVRGDDASIASLDDLLAHRVERLPDDARQLFEVCAVAGRPMPVDVAVAAAGLSGEGDRAGDAAARAAPPRAQSWRSAASSPITIACARARSRGCPRRASASCIVASPRASRPPRSPTPNRSPRTGAAPAISGARPGGRTSRRETAMNTYAFNRATALYRQVLESPSSPRRSATSRRLASLTRCQTPAGSTRRRTCSARLSNEADGTEQIDLRRHQVDQLLRRGRLAEGRVLARQVLQSVGLGMPSTRSARRARGAREPIHAAAARPRLQRAPAPTRCRRDLLQRLDVLWSVSSGFSFIDPIVGRALQSRYMRLALAGRRAASAPGSRSGSTPAIDRWPASRCGTSCEEVRERGLAIAERLGEAQLRGHIQTTSGFAAMSERSVRSRARAARRGGASSPRGLRRLPVPHRHLRDHAARMLALPRTDPRDEPAARDPRARGRGERRRVHDARSVRLARQCCLAAARSARCGAAQPGSRCRRHAVRPTISRSTTTTSCTRARRSISTPERSTRPPRACRSNGSSSRGVCCCGSNRCGSRGSSCAVDWRLRVPRGRPKARPSDARSASSCARWRSGSKARACLGRSRSPSCCAQVRRT